MKIFESHAHYEDKAFSKDREALLWSLPQKGIERVVNVSSSLETIRKTMKLISQYPFLYGTVGVHPCDTEPLSDKDMLWMQEQCAKLRVVAVGEIGLDYYWDTPARSVQKKWFEEQLELARRVSLPVVIHSRDAAADTLAVMKDHHAADIGGVVHCFSYGIEMAREFLNMGFYIGIGGVITFKNAKKLKEVAAYAPLDRILLETDCPYLTPVPYRGERNSSLNLPLIAEQLAAVKGVTVEEIADITYKNAMNMYRINAANAF